MSISSVSAATSGTLSGLRDSMATRATISDILQLDGNLARVSRRLSTRGYLHSSVDDRGWQIATKAAAAIWFGVRPGVVLSGKTGVGKSFLANAIFGGKGVRIDLSGTRSVDAWQWNQAFAEPGYSAERCIWLIDDVGTEDVSIDYGNRIDNFAQFLMRWDRLSAEWKLFNPLLITSNLDKDDMRDRYGDRIVSRLSPLAWFELIGPDRRMQDTPKKGDAGQQQQARLVLNQTIYA